MSLGDDSRDFPGETPDSDDGDVEGPVGQRARSVRTRLTTTMHKDLRMAAAQTETSMDELAREGMRYVLYGVPPRHKALIKRAL